jgi:DNA-binding transcriptional LysR family regulator
MFDWEDLRHFLMLAREGSLSAAARKLHVDHVTVARRIAALEHDLTLKLVDRRARSYALTAEGARLAVLAENFQNHAAEIDRFARAASGGIAGKVTISAPPGLAMRFVAPHLADLRHAHPQLTLVLRGEMRLAALDRNEADIAVRLSRPQQGALTIRKIGEMPFGLFGTADWRSRPAEEWVFITNEPDQHGLPQQEWLRRIVGSRSIGLMTDDVESQIAAARAGLGLAALPLYAAATAPELVAYEAPPLSRDIWLVVHDDMRMAPAVRLVADHLAAAIGRDLPA